MSISTVGAEMLNANEENMEVELSGVQGTDVAAGDLLLASSNISRLATSSALVSGTAQKAQGIESQIVRQ